LSASATTSGPIPSPPITASLIAEDPMRRTLLAARGAGVPSVVAPVQGHLNRLRGGAGRVFRETWTRDAGGRRPGLPGTAGRPPAVLGPGQHGLAG
jgi:hypothetical protein